MEEGYFDSRSEACIHDFQEFLSRDSYIATSEYDSFLEMYRDVFELFSKYLTETSSLYQELMKISNQGSELIKEHKPEKPEKPEKPGRPGRPENLLKRRSREKRRK